jgi:hypothetical protein
MQDLITEKENKFSMALIILGTGQKLVTYYLQILLAISVLIHNLKKLYGIV